MSKRGHYLGGNQTLKIKNHFDLKDKKTWLFNKGQMTESAVEANRCTRKRLSKKGIGKDIAKIINQAWQLERLRLKRKKLKISCYD